MNLNSLEPQDILYRRDIERYPGWAGVCSSFDPDTDPVEVHVEHSPAANDPVIVGDVLPDEIAAVLALTPGVVEDTPWEEREQLAAAVAETNAAGLAESWWAFVEKPVKYEPDGDVLWA